MVFRKDFIHRIKVRLGAKLRDSMNLLVKGGIPLCKIDTIFQPFHHQRTFRVTSPGKYFNVYLSLIHAMLKLYLLH